MSEAPENPAVAANHDELSEEIRELRARLQEAEETLRAIRSGEVDALVISGQAGEQIFTLKGADEAYRLIVQSMHEGALSVDDSGSILFCNRRLGELLACPLEELIGSCLYNGVMPEDHAALSACLAQARTSHVEQEVRLVSRTGNRIVVNISASPLIVNEARSVIAIVTDLTERKASEASLLTAHRELENRVEVRTAELKIANAQLSEQIDERLTIEKELRRTEEALRRHTEELEQIIAERTERIRELEHSRAESEKLIAVGRMAARVAHEINNPLAGVKNSFRLVKKDIPPDSAHQHFVLLIDRELDRIARIVRQMFDLVRPVPQDADVCVPAATVEDVITLLDGNFRSRGVKPVLDVKAAAVPVRTQGDALKQVLFNLLQNAIEASEAGSDVIVKAGIHDGQLELIVTDHGCGIPPEARSQIFEPFFTTKDRLPSGGMGLGLSVTRNVLNGMGGSLTFESDLGVGTTFQVRIPVEVQTSPARR